MSTFFFFPFPSFFLVRLGLVSPLAPIPTADNLGQGLVVDSSAPTRSQADALAVGCRRASFFFFLVLLSLVGTQGPGLDSLVGGGDVHPTAMLPAVVTMSTSFALCFSPPSSLLIIYCPHDE